MSLIKHLTKIQFPGLIVKVTNRLNWVFDLKTSLSLRREQRFGPAASCPDKTQKLTFRTRLRLLGKYSSHDNLLHLSTPPQMWAGSCVCSPRGCLYDCPVVWFTVQWWPGLKVSRLSLKCFWSFFTSVTWRRRRSQDQFYMIGFFLFPGLWTQRQVTCCLACSSFKKSLQQSLAH